jgi:pectate lyase
LTGIGLLFRKQKNLIIRNIVSSSVPASNGDALTIDVSNPLVRSVARTDSVQASTNVWVDHCEFHSVKGNDKDFYDGLVDVTHGSDFVTISQYVAAIV